MNPVATKEKRMRLLGWSLVAIVLLVLPFHILFTTREGSSTSDEISLGTEGINTEALEMGGQSVSSRQENERDSVKIHSGIVDEKEQLKNK